MRNRTNINCGSRVPALLLGVFLCLGMFLPAPATAQQQKDPALPPALQTLSDEGAQMRYLGKIHGMDGWISIKNGQEQYFYVTPDGGAMVMGLLFDRDGKILTLEQVNALRQQEGEILDLFAAPSRQERAAEESQKDEMKAAQYQNPSEQLYSNLEDSNWVAFGQPDAPVVYSFIDPQCPHCQNFIRDLKDNYIGNGLVQLRVIPVGFRDETLAQAAFLLAAPDPEDRFYRHLEGDESALPVTRRVNQQGVQRNMAIMQSWQFGVTPLSVYRAADGSVKIVQGRVKDIPALIRDLP